MIKKNLLKVTTLFLACGFITLQSVSAQIWIPDRKEPRPPFPGHPRRFVDLPVHYNAILVSDITYYYSNGSFYRQAATGYVLVTAPIGAVVPAIPVDYQTIIVNGTTYFIYDNIYYVKQTSNYVVVPAPVITVETKSTTSDSNDNCYVVNVPNVNGSYIPVVIRKEGTAYIGPQGEYYDKAPTVEQLKAMYSK